MTEFLEQLHPALLALIRVLLLVVPILMVVPGLIWWERRLLSWMQDRIGPNRVGPFGLLQPIADGVKLFFKEDITPNTVDRVIYFVAPAVDLFPAFALGATMPWGPSYGTYGLLTPISSANIGILYVLAISSLGVYGVVLAGYASNNKYSLMGGLRASAQLISYELAMGVSLACIVMATGSLRLVDIVKAQESPLWGSIHGVQNWFIFTPFGLVSAIIFLICMIAETNRAPFDLPEAENELIAGYHTEYSSMKFAVFFMGEYAAMLVFGGIFACVFLGGYNFMPFDWKYLEENYASAAPVWHILNGVNYWLAPAFFVGKMMAMITFYIWLRATLPRLRYDQLMSLGWKTLLPLAVANFIVVAVWIISIKLYGPWGGLLSAILGIGIAIGLFNAILRTKNSGGATLERQPIVMTDGAAEQRKIELVEGA